MVLYMKFLLCILATLVLIKTIINCTCNLRLGIISMEFGQCCQCGMIIKMMIGMETLEFNMTETNLRVACGFNSEEVLFSFSHNTPYIMMIGRTTLWCMPKCMLLKFLTWRRSS